MPKTSLNNLLTQLKTDYPQINFVTGDRFLFHPPNTIKFTTEGNPLLLLHELGHALINRTDYIQDIELIEIESLAWQKARELCSKYHIAYDEDLAESTLDTYRDWLHANSLCPNCQLNGYQDRNSRYHCPLCGKTWLPKHRPQ